MAEILSINECRKKLTARRAFAYWKKKFNETYTAESLLSDLSNQTLYCLVLSGKESNIAFHELILGVLNIGDINSFYSFEKGTQMKIIDIHLYALDQCRFEMMLRLGWLYSYPCSRVPIIDLVTAFESLKNTIAKYAIELSENHPEYERYIIMSNLEKDEFVKKMIPEALNQFRKMVIS